MNWLKSERVIVGIIALSVLVSIIAWDPSDRSASYGNIASIGVAGATLILALVTYRAVIEGREESLRNQRAFYKPILVPSNLPNLDNLINARERHIAISNTGTGIASNIRGLLALYTEEQQFVPTQFSMRYAFPLPAGKPVQTLFQVGGTIFDQSDSVNGVPLFIAAGKGPPMDVADIVNRDQRYIGRLTLSCKDVFGKNHASVFDITIQAEYEFVAALDGIEMDLAEMGRLKPSK